MYDCSEQVTKALYKALTTPPLQNSAGDDFNVFTQPNTAANEYVLISQVTAAQGLGGNGCRQWECTALLSVFTAFKQENIVSQAPAYFISNQILDRVVDTRLELSDGFTMSPISVKFTNNTSNAEAQYTYFNRFIRLEFSVYQ